MKGFREYNDTLSGHHTMLWTQPEELQTQQKGRRKKKKPGENQESPLHPDHPHFWRKCNQFLHREEALYLGEVRTRLNSALAKKRAEVQRTQWGMADHVRVSQESVKVPKLKLPAIPRATGTRREAQTAREGGKGRELANEMSELSLRNAITHREHRQDILEQTQMFSREEELKPYVLQSSSPRASMTSREQDRRMETVMKEMIAERGLLQQLNHSIRCHLQRTSRAEAGPPRSLLVKEIQRSIANIRADVTLLDESSRAYSTQDLSPMKDFLKANKHELLTGRAMFKGGRLFRQNLGRIAKMENALQRRAEDMFQRCECMESIILRRQKRQIQITFESAAERRKTAQREWLTILATCVRLLQMRRLYSLEQGIRSAQVRIISKFWCKFRERKRVQQLHALQTLTRWGRQVIPRWRMRKHGKRVDLLLLFLRDLERVSFIREHIRSYRKKIVLLQQQIRLYLQRAKVSRRRLNVVFDKVERQVLAELMKHKAAHRRPSEDLSVMNSKYKIQPVDWSTMAPEISRLQVDVALKNKAFTNILRSLRRQFAREREKYLVKMIEYRGIFRRSILFRTRMQDFLDGTGNPDKFLHLDSFVNQNKGTQEALRSINKAMPTPPEFKDTISEEQMRHVVVLCLYLESKKNVLLKILIKIAEPPDPKVMDVLLLRRLADEIAKDEREESVQGERRREEEAKHAQIAMEK